MRLDDSLIHVGHLVQTVVSYYNSYTNGSTTKAYNDTLPTSSDGTEIVTVSITPKSASNVLRVSAQVIGALGAASGMTVWVLRDSVANALGAAYVTPPSGDYGIVVPLTIDEVASNIVATTFKLRVGSTSGTWYINGTSAGRRHGGAMKTFIRVDEVSA
jgi:hypothetical protein